VFDAQWQFPGTLCLYGASQAGKSTFMLNLIKSRKTLFGNQPIDHVYYIYTSYQTKFDEFLRDNPSTVTFLPSYTELPSNVTNSIVVYDDHQLVFQSDSAARMHITDVFQRIAHHNNLFCVCILQTIHNNKLRSLALNSTYQVYFPSIRDNLQISYLNREYFPQYKHFLIEVVRDILKKPHGYLVIDCSRRSQEQFRVRNFVIPHLDSKIYRPKEHGQTVPT
jgi:hypothetical protein